jgi:phosphatidylserine/phosphatidylglycerophosphate/cardiolipin synthase-like enzyme
MLLQTGTTCWRVETAPRAAVIIDIADYFTAAKAAMSKATRSIHFLNWAFEPNTYFNPRPGGAGALDDRFDVFLKRLAAERPDLDVRLLCWKSALPVAATQGFFPWNDEACFRGSRVKFVLDGTLPRGACHHQKMIVVDDAVAFCGGADIGPDRWDTCEHLDDDPRRVKAASGGKHFDSRHEVMSLVDGAAALALGDLFRDRWRRATGEQLDRAKGSAADAWPEFVVPMFRNARVGMSRTEAAWRGAPEVRESQTLYLASIAAARRCIYLENQYFTSPVMARALANRLEESDGPEVILISAGHSPSYFDKLTMDRTRSTFIKELKAADAHGRFRIYSPVTTLGRTIIVHAKLAIIDDGLVRIGSSNMNNRSFGFDTECDLSVEASGEEEAKAKAAIGSIRTRLISHWLGCPDEALTRAIEAKGSLGAAIDHLRLGGFCRLRPIEPKPLGPLPTLVATFHLGDPVGPEDAWRPWKRRRLLAEETAEAQM